MSMDRLELQYGRAIDLATGDAIPVGLYALDGIDLVTAPSLSAGDVKIGLDGAAVANIAALPTLVGDVLYLKLSAAELQSKRGYIAFRKPGTFATKEIRFITVDHPLAGKSNGVLHYGLVAGQQAGGVTLASGVETFLDDLYQSLLRIRHGGLSAIGTLAISATATKFKTTTTLSFVKAGLTGTKAATDSLVFSAADTINVGTTAGLFWGAWLVTYDGTSAFATQSPSANQVYASEALAKAAAKALQPASGTFPVGIITVECNTGAAWTANTSNLTASSGCTARNFYDADLVANLEEWFDSTAYVASTKVLSIARNAKIMPLIAVDEYWLYGASYPSTTGEVADALLRRKQNGLADGTTGNRVMDALAAGLFHIHDNSGGVDGSSYQVKDCDGTVLFTFTPTRLNGLNPARTFE